MKKEIITPDFIIIPYQLLIDDNLSPLDRVLYGAIYWFDHLKDGKCTASNDTLAKLLNVKSRSVANGLNNLEKNGYIERYFKDESRRKRNNIKALVSFKKVKHVSSNDIGDTLNNVTVTLNNVTGVTLNNEQNNNSTIKKNNEKEYNSAKTEVFAENNLNKLISLFQPINPSYERIYSNKTQRAALARLVEKYSYEKVKNMLKSLPAILTRKYAPRITTPFDLEKDLGKLLLFIQQEKSKTKNVIKV